MVKIKGTSVLRLLVAGMFAVAFSLVRPNFVVALEKEDLDTVAAEIEEIKKEDPELAEEMTKEFVEAAKSGELDIDLGEKEDDKSFIDLSTAEGKQKALEIIQADYDSGKSGLSAEKLAAVKEAVSGYTDKKSFEEKMKTLFEGEHQGEAIGKEGDFKEFMKTFEGQGHADYAKEAVFEALEKAGGIEDMEKIIGHELSETEKADMEKFKTGSEAEQKELMEKYGREGTMDKEAMERMAKEFGEREMGGHEREAFERGTFEREAMERGEFDRETMEREALERGWEPPERLPEPPPPPPPPGG